MAEFLDQSDFAVAFAFNRPVAAPYRTSSGDLVTAPIDVPRFDHDPDGNPLGLLVESGAYLGQADRAQIDPLMLPEDITGQQVTIFHARSLTGGTIERRAYYSRNAAATIDALLGTAGHHAEIGVIGGYRENKGGHVRYRGQSWYLVRMIAASATHLLSDAAGRPLISG